MAKQKLTAEEQFLEKWHEFGYPDSDIVPQFRFHPVRRWRFDWAWPSRKVAIEVNGRGRHQTVVGVRNDCEKCNTAVEMGWVVLHLPTSDIKGKGKDGEPLIEKFIDLVCRVLSTRDTYVNEAELGKGME